MFHADGFHSLDHDVAVSSIGAQPRLPASNCPAIRFGHALVGDTPHMEGTPAYRLYAFCAAVLAGVLLSIGDVLAGVICAAVGILLAWHYVRSDGARDERGIF